MSSFALVSEDGIPDFMVEVGEPISTNTTLLSGFFTAIASLSAEVTDTQIQVIQTRGFTIQFGFLENGYLLVVGTNHSVLSSSSILEEIKKILDDGYQYKIDRKKLYRVINDLLQEYMESKPTQIENEEELHPDVKRAFKLLARDFIKIINWGVLAGYCFRFPKTKSAEINNYITSALGFLNKRVRSEVDPTCSNAIKFISLKGEFTIDEDPHVYTAKKLKKTSLVKNLMKLHKSEEYLTWKGQLKMHTRTIDSFQHLLSDIDTTSSSSRYDLDQIRFFLDNDIEFFTLHRIHLTNPELYDYYIRNTNELEWVTKW